jgi:hypothetical protein
MRLHTWPTLRPDGAFSIHFQVQTHAFQAVSFQQVPPLLLAAEPDAPWWIFTSVSATTPE